VRSYYRCQLAGIVLAAAASSLLPESGLAYRPFESTDADVTDADELEIELGYFTFERFRDEDAVSIPQFVLNYGLTDSLELVAEFEAVKPEHRSGEIEDVGLFLKQLLRRGVLQDEAGLSIAFEGGVLVPAHNAEQAGLEAIGIVSGQAGKVTYHVNFGGGLDRNDRDQFGIWGAIFEYPLNSRVRIAGEISGEKVHGEPKESSVLIGLIFESPSTGNSFDGGLRRGVSSAAPDWQVTFGWTFSYPRP
jgi:hypothetical protein